MDLNIFNHLDFLSALKAFFNGLKVPVNYIADEPDSAKNILSSTYRDNEAFLLMDDVYIVGMIDDAAFAGNKSPEVSSIHADYDGILIFGVELKKRSNGLLPTRGQLAEISRAFNREFHFTPVVVIFKYDGQIAFANTERIKYKQGWREGEKAGKVSVLRDVTIQKPHRGHLEILKELEIPTSGKNVVDSFAILYKYWQEVFSVSILNKKFYNELQNWYFWAIKEVTYPNAPNRFDFETNEKFDEAVKEHKGKNVIRLLTRILFIWFIKEKKLIPEQLFDEKLIANKLIKDFTPQKPQGVFATGKQNSPYYRAILQNLFFATLNQEMGKRAFRGDGQHQNVTNLMRYKSYFKDPEYFVQLMEEVVPFMNGGLFECLDKPHPTIKGKQGGDIIIYNDGFSDRDDNLLVVPDYLFFDVDEEVDLSDDFGNKVYKNSKTRGLLEILQSYKFTITENTPIEEDVALDPELLGKVFENLLASYNPETKTTARKQTGSFYTPREIVNYMVDESLITYLKSTLKDEITTEEQFDQDLHQLLSYDTINPYQENPDIQKKLIKALDQCTILDPACGSGAFPMGILQKMVHVLHKIDPKNTEWEQRQIDRVNKAIENLEEIDDVRFREQSIKELKAQIKDIEDSFENNELDYGRKLYLIENCIYGVDIQSIATQISKLRFFISLIVDQKIDRTKENFGIRPLPNLETKFVAANTLIGIANDNNLSNTDIIRELKKELKKVRHRLFSAKTPSTKQKLRKEDEILRRKIADELMDTGWQNETANQLASWDPYDQNESSLFFDSEWMFDISTGFDIVIGNPPYLQVPKGFFSIKQYPYSEGKDQGKQNLYKVFVEASKNLSKNSTGTACLIVQSSLLCDLSSKHTREMLLKETTIFEFLEFPKLAPTKEGQVFENVLQGTCIYRFIKKTPKVNSIFRISINNDVTTLKKLQFEEIVQNTIFELYPDTYYIPLVKQGDFIPMKEANSSSISLKKLLRSISQGDINLTSSKDYFVTDNSDIKLFRGKNVQRFYLIDEVDEFLTEGFKTEKVGINSQKEFIVCQEITGTTDKYRLHFTLTPLNKKFLFGHTANKLSLINEKANKSIAVIANSLFMDWLFRKTSTNNHVMGYEISQFPIPLLHQNFTSILNLKYDIMSYLSINNNHYKIFFEGIMNAIVFELYFHNHMNEREIDVLKFIERDIQKVIQGRDFDKLNVSEKEQVIEQLHQVWTHLDNEVRNRIKLFAVRSPEILKPILES